MKKFLYWSPRVLALFYNIFLFTAAFDVFNIQTSVPIMYLLAAFLLHAIPALVLTVILLIAWWYEKAGGILFILFAVGMAILFSHSLAASLMLLSLPLTAGILFLLDNNFQEDLHKKTQITIFEQ